ncbi:hypothetical protein [Falsihalocynthiibacter arcticus]|uniref:Uncharacterized protein n=1 Tax=Falsihalocynthiibacter arcticus TaxID=1579316 RepID=A0A126V5Z6_9RHOB|nr:hypothetical protein [Falsihalocynthiibacter arcticus]AML53702.1 hypothetical protein RC74_16115 [Falsihalocynthiibacter arcticus]
MSKHWRSNHSQVYWTCMALTQGRTINHMDEIGEVKGWRLGAIIHTLRHQYQWPIETEFKGPERIAHYSLVKGTDWRALKFPPSAKEVRAALKEAQNITGGSADE